MTLFSVTIFLIGISCSSAGTCGTIWSFECQRHGRLLECGQKLVVKSGAVSHAVALHVKRRAGHNDEIELIKHDGL